MSTPQTPAYPSTVTWAGEALSLPEPAIVEAYAVAMWGADHDPLERLDLVTVAGQYALDAERGQDPYGVRG